MDLEVFFGILAGALAGNFIWYIFVERRDK